MTYKELSSFQNQTYKIDVETYVSESAKKVFEFEVDISCDNYVSRKDNCSRSRCQNLIDSSNEGKLDTRNYEKRTSGEIKKLLITNNMGYLERSTYTEYARYVLEYFICIALSEYRSCFDGCTISGLISYPNKHKNTRKDVILEILNDTNIQRKNLDDGEYYLEDISDYHHPYPVVKRIIGLCCAIICNDKVLGF